MSTATLLDAYAKDKCNARIDSILLDECVFDQPDEPFPELAL